MRGPAPHLGRLAAGAAAGVAQVLQQGVAAPGGGAVQLHQSHRDGLPRRHPPHRPQLHLASVEHHLRGTRYTGFRVCNALSGASCTSGPCWPPLNSICTGKDARYVGRAAHPRARIAPPAGRPPAPTARQKGEGATGPATYFGAGSPLQTLPHARTEVAARWQASRGVRHPLGHCPCCSCARPISAARHACAFAFRCTPMRQLIGTRSSPLGPGGVGIATPVRWG
jgi:hypothetical protein